MILLVDDEPLMRLLLVEYLRPLNMEMYEAENGRAALSLIAEKGHPALIISDLMMPIMDGFEFLEILKESPDTSHIPFMVISANTHPDIKHKALDKGAIRFISKPVSPDEFVADVERLVLNGQK